MATFRQALASWRRDGEPTLRSIARSWCWVTWHRAKNRWYDLRAILAGYCNDCPYSGDPGEGGGYAHWRCAHRRGHDGLHRSNNYVWSDDGQTDYVPIPHGQDTPTEPWAGKRSMTPTMRQARQGRHWQEERARERRERIGA